MKAYIFYRQLFDPSGEHIMVGGIETYLMDLSDVLIEKGITPTIIQSSLVDFEKKLNGITIKGYHVKANNIYKQLYLKIKDEISEEDLVIWGLDRASVKIPHKRTISIQHGIPFDYYQEERKLHRILKKCGLGHFLKRVQRSKAIKAFKNSTVQVCVDYNFWNWYRTFCLPEEESNIYVIPNYAKVNKLKEHRNIKAGEVLKIIFARRFVRMRGVEEYIKVAEHFKNDKRVSVTFAGEGPYIQKIADVAQNSNNIFITKYQSGEAVEFHCDYDVAVVPSIASEGTSLSLLEAMAAGNVVISTCVGGMTNIILDGFNGFFVRPNNSDDIIKVIENLLLDEEIRKIVSNNAVETIKQSFSFDIWKKKWNVVIDNVYKQ